MWKLILTSLLLLVSQVVSATVGNPPLGVRNNNPGNIISTDITWKGEIECSSRFECFESPEAGLRAMAKNLLSYQTKHGLQTVGEIINRWSPPHENRTDALSRAACSRLEIQCDEPIQLVSSSHFKELIKALVVQENGYNPYSDELIEGVLHGITNSDGNDDNASWGIGRRDNEAVGNETTVPVAATRNDDQNDQSGQRIQREDSQVGERTLPVDTTNYCSNGGILCTASTEVSSRVLSARHGHSWLDRVGSGLALLQRKGRDYLAYNEGPSRNPTGHTLRQPYTRPVFWWFNSWA